MANGREDVGGSRDQALNVTRMIRITVTKNSMLFDFIV